MANEKDWIVDRVKGEFPDKVILLVQVDALGIHFDRVVERMRVLSIKLGMPIGFNWNGAAVVIEGHTSTEAAREQMDQYARDASAVGKLEAEKRRQRLTNSERGLWRWIYGSVIVFLVALVVKSCGIL